MSIDRHLRLVDDSTAAAFLAELIVYSRAERTALHRTDPRTQLDRPSSPPAPIAEPARIAAPDPDRFKLTDDERARGLERVAQLRRQIEQLRSTSTWDSAS